MRRRERERERERERSFFLVKEEANGGWEKELLMCSR